MHQIGLIGFGKIATTRHVPAIMAHPGFQLAGVVDSGAIESRIDGVRTFTSHMEMFAALPELDCVAICTPPLVRARIALDAIALGKNVLLEKPPAAGVTELAILRAARERSGVTMFTAWHSQHNPAVNRARQLLEGVTVTRIEMRWKEDVQRYHPGQEWIWQAGGFGVFDPGINALSILTRILPGSVTVRAAALAIADQAATPIAARLEFGLVGWEGACGTAEFDWRAAAGEIREISISTEDGDNLLLSASGRALSFNGAILMDGDRDEYGRLYAHFYALLERRASDIDEEPSLLVADAFQIGLRVPLAEF